MNETELLDEIFDLSKKLFKKIEDYILTTPAWIYYFVDDDDVKKLLYNHPDDWNKHILEVKAECFNGLTAKLKITIDNGRLDNDIICRQVSLPSFHILTESRKSRYDGQIKDALIEECEINIKNYEEALQTYKNRLQQLKNGK